MTQVLVTGGHGLLGSWLVKALLARGDGVSVLERGERPGSALALEGTAGQVELLRGDIRDGDSLDRALAARPADVVFHLAGQAIAGAARRGPAATFETNVGGTWTVLEACRRAGVGRVLVASSDTVYGPSAVPCGEARALAPGDPYDASKAAADLIARSYAAAFGLPVAVARMANVYGGGDMHASRLVPGATWAALAGRRPVIRSDGTPTRDLLYVADAVAAYLAIEGALAGGAAGGEAFNAGGGETRRVLEVVRAVFAAAGAPFDPDIRGAGAPGGEAGRPAADHARLTRLTGWAPRVGLADGVARTVDWYRRHAPRPPVG